MTRSGFHWGIPGPGRIAEEFSTALAVVDDSCLYGVASRDRPRTDKFARDTLDTMVLMDQLRRLIGLKYDFQ